MALDDLLKLRSDAGWVEGFPFPNWKAQGL